MGGFFEWSAEDFCYEWLVAGDCVVESDGVVDDEVLHLDVVGDKQAGLFAEALDTVDHLSCKGLAF